jgi:enamine deaminase RidA (YjgF/YER057c/UK114 family)
LGSQRQYVSTGSPFESKVGISRAVRSGNIIAVTGSAPLGKDGKTVAEGNAPAQARRCLEIIQFAIEGLGGKLSDVTRTRILLTRIEAISPTEIFSPVVSEMAIYQQRTIMAIEVQSPNSSKMWNQDERCPG